MLNINFGRLVPTKRLPVFTTFRSITRRGDRRTLATSTPPRRSGALEYDLTNGSNVLQSPSRIFFTIGVEETNFSPTRASADWFWLLEKSPLQVHNASYPFYHSSSRPIFLNLLVGMRGFLTLVAGFHALFAFTSAFPQPEKIYGVNLGSWYVSRVPHR